MFVRKFKQDRQELLAEGKSIVRSSADSKYIYRVTLVNMLLAGAKSDEIAELSGCGESTLLSWLRKVDENGWDAIRAKKQKGRPSLLTPDQALEIKRAVEGDPSDEGYNVWDGPTVSDFIEKKFQLKVSVRRCQELLHKLGFSLVRPQPYPSKENPDNEAREDFKKNSNS